MGRVSKTELHRAISRIMETSDLDTLTTKKIRLICEDKYDIDLGERKGEIDSIVMDFVKKHSRNGEIDLPPKKRIIPPSPPETPDKSDEESSDDSSESESCSDSECSESSCPDNKNKAKAAGVKVEAPRKVAVINKDASSYVPMRQKPVQTLPPKKAFPKKDANQGLKRSASAAAMPAKTPKKVAPEKMMMDDAAYARQLQAEEWNLRQRSNRKSVWFN